MEPQIVENYVKTGQVRFEYRDFAFLGDESRAAAESSSCALDQDKFWEFHDILFANQVGENNGAFDRGRLDRMAERVGLNMDQFSTCMDDGAFEDGVEQSYQAGIAAGVQATPSFTINGELLDGVNNYQSIAAAIDEALAGS